MSLQIVKSTGVVSPLSILWFIHGYKAIGKSTLFSKFPHTLYITTEKRHDHISGIEYVYVINWQELLAVTKSLASPVYYSKYRFIVIDVIDLTYQYCIQYICKHNYTQLVWENWKEPGWGKGEDSVDAEYRKWYINLLTLPYGFAFISHTKVDMVEKIVNKVSVMKPKVESGLHKRAKVIIMPPIDITGHMKYENVLYTDAKGKLQNKKVRLISFDGDDLVEAGDGIGYMPKKLVVDKDPSLMYKKIVALYETNKVT